tara:strand:+ start:1231 stop:1983 length:753 start_codon:yes stop_codon:yes gene_type:complete
MEFDRLSFAQEQMLRKQIRKAISIVKEKRDAETKAKLLEEAKLRRVIRKLISETTVGASVPERKTGRNQLEKVLKEIIKILEEEFKQLTTSAEQRNSFKKHILNGVKNLLATERIGPDEDGVVEEPIAEQEIDIEVGEDEDEAFIDVRPDADQEIEVSPEEEFGIEGEDKTGRNFAYDAFKRIENQIMKGYEKLDTPEDRDIFYDYLLINLDLYFKKFEDELQQELPEPSVPEPANQPEEEPEFEDELGL